MADNPFMVSRKALYDAVGNDRVALAIERLIQQAVAQRLAEVLLASAPANPSPYPAGRVLIAGDGVEFDTLTDGELTIQLADPLTISALTVDDLTVTDDATVGGDLAVTGGATVGGSASVGGDLAVAGEAKAASLYIDAPEAPFTGLIDFSTPIVVNGTTYYLPLSSTP